MKDYCARFSRELLRVENLEALNLLVEQTAQQCFDAIGAHLVWRTAADAASNKSPPEANDCGRAARAAGEEFQPTESTPGDRGSADTCWHSLIATDQTHLVFVWSRSASEARVGGADWTRFLDDIAIAGARLLELDALADSVRRLEHAEHVQRALFAIADMASSNLEMPDMLRGIHSIVGELMYAENFFITLYQPERDSLRFLYFADIEDSEHLNPEKEIPAIDLPHSLTLAMIRSGQSQMGPSMQVRARLGMLRGARLGPESEDWLGVPMIGAGAIRGAIVVQSYRADTRYTEKDRTLLTYVAQHILTALERKQAKEELERRVEERTLELASAIGNLQQEVAERQRSERLQRALFRIVERASTAGSMDAFYTSMHEIVGELLNARNFYIALISPEGNELEFPYSVDEVDAVRPRRPMLNGMTEYVLRTGRAMLLNREGIDHLLQTGGVQRFGTRARCWLGVPLICDDRAVGVLAVQSYSDDAAFSERDQELLTFVAYHIASGLERKLAQESLHRAYLELEERVLLRTQELARANQDLTGQVLERERIEARLMHQALHDTLTGLPNRALLLDRLANAILCYEQDPACTFAVLFLDLDRFKVVNDSEGHLVGDDLLKQAANRLAHVCAPHLIARLGGDEFAVLLTGIAGTDEAVEIAGFMLSALEAPIRVGEKEMFTSASIGIAYMDTHYTRAEELLRDADVAMYRAKAQGRQRYEIFDERLRAEALRALNLENDLRHALARAEFEPHFQSIVSLKDGRVLGYEALLRWRHPGLGLLLPDEFLSAAEDSGCIEQIDWQMFMLACEQAKKLPDDTYVSINISALRLRAADFDQVALRIIAASGLHAHRVRFEVTEGALLNDPEQTRCILLRLRDAGVLVQLDDFGTGYSSLSYLHRFPIHSLKIDRSFVADLDSAGHTPVVVRAISALAASLGIEVIAEGVETEAQRDALIEMGCTIGQGFLFSRPVLVDELFNPEAL